MGKPMIEHNLEVVHPHVDEIIIVTKYLAERFPETLWDNYKWTPITYKLQWKEKWTGAALFGIESDIDVLVFYGDSILDRSDLEAIIDHPGYACMVKEVQDPSRYGIFSLTEIWNIKQVVEKPTENIWNLANAGIYKLPGDIFEALKQIELSPRGEYELTDAVNIIAEKFPLKPLTISGYYIDIWFPWNIHDVNSYMLSKLESSDIKWVLEDETNIKWNVVIEEGAIIKSGTYMEWNCYIWKDAVIWPNAYIRWNSYIWEWSKVWFSVELKNSTVWDHTNIWSLTLISESVIGNNTVIHAWYTTPILKDKNWVHLEIKWSRVNTNKKCLGVIIWDNTTITK